MPLMHYMLQYNANKYVFNDRLKVSLVSDGSQDSLAVSSRLSSLQQKMHNSLTWCNGVVAQWTDGD